MTRMSTGDKQRYRRVALAMSLIAAVCVGITALTGVTQAKSPGLRIVASFYPVYTAAVRLTEGVPGASVVNLTPNQTGCLHDYQLTPDNMITLTGADALVLVGAGAENFLDDVRARYPGLPVVDTSAGVTLLEADHHHEHGEDAAEDHQDEHDEEDGVIYNEHIWTSPSRYIQQINTLCDGLAALNPANADRYRANADAYIADIEEIKTQLLAAAAALPTRYCITFHDSLTYFAEELGLTPIASLSVGEESGVSAADLAAASSAAEQAGKVLLMYDSQYDAEYAAVASQTTYSAVLTLDTAVMAGNGTPPQDAWLAAMRHNLQQLKEAAA